jgi:hypothetical protein
MKLKMKNVNLNWNTIVKKTSGFCLTGAVITTLACSSSAFGAYSGVVAGIPTAVPATTAPTGTLLASESVVFATADFDGTLTTRVYSGDAATGGTGLTFAYSFSSISGGGFSELAVNGWGPPAFPQVAYLTGTVAPDFAYLVGGTLNYTWATAGLVPGNSATVYAATTETIFVPSSATVQDGDATVPLATWSPTSVPEPSTVIAGLLVLLPSGASTLQILRKKRSA